jgi:hypothetical protein
MKTTKKIAGILLIVLLIVLSIFMISCEKETITPIEPPITDTIPVVDLDNYIQIKGGDFYHNPKMIISVTEVIWVPSYSEVYFEDYEYTQEEFEQTFTLIDGEYYEIIPILGSEIIEIDTIISGEIYNIEVPEVNDTSFIIYDIDVKYLDNQYDYENSINTKIYYEDIKYFDIIGKFFLSSDNFYQTPAENLHITNIYLNRRNFK